MAEPVRLDTNIATSDLVNNTLTAGTDVSTETGGAPYASNGLMGSKVPS